MSSAIGCVVVGYGATYSWGRHHAKWIEQTNGLTLYGICDTDEGARNNAREDFSGTIKLFTDFDEVLEDDAVEMVSVVTPYDTHAPLAIRALEASKHVLTEKVMCLTTSEADALIQTAEERGKMLSVFQNRRWDSDFLTVKKVIRDGMLGDIFLIESCVSGHEKPSGWRAAKKHGGGQLYDWGAHLFDQAMQLVESDPVALFADVQQRVWDVDVDTFAKVVIRFENGCLYEVDLGNVQWASKPRWQVFGEKGTLVKKTFKPAEKAHVKTAVGGIPAELPVESVPGDWAEVYRNISSHLNEGAELIVKPQEVRKSIAVIEAAFESAALGRSVPLK